MQSSSEHPTLHLVLVTWLQGCYFLPLNCNSSSSLCKLLGWACWDVLCSYGLVDSGLTVYEGDMCSSSNHKLFLESDGAYVAPPVGVILASASPWDANLQKQASEETFLQWLIVLQQIFCCFCRACLPMFSVGQHYQHLSVIRSRASCISSLHTKASM